MTLLLSRLKKKRKNLLNLSLSQALDIQQIELTARARAREDTLYHLSSRISSDPGEVKMKDYLKVVRKVGRRKGGGGGGGEGEGGKRDFFIFFLFHCFLISWGENNFLIELFR